MLWRHLQQSNKESDPMFQTETCWWLSGSTILLTLTFYIWVGWWESSSVPLVLERSSSHGNPSSTAGILTQPHPNHQICPPSSAPSPTVSGHFGNSLGVHPSHPRKHFILTMDFSFPPGQCEIMRLDIWTKVRMEGSSSSGKWSYQKTGKPLGLQAQ